MFPNYWKEAEVLIGKYFINTYDFTSKRHGQNCAAGVEVKLESYSGV